jgi:transmembrane sensor
VTRPNNQQLAALEQAAEWFTRLQDVDAVSIDQSAWREWLEQREENRWAWAQCQQLQQRLHGLPAGLTRRALALADQQTHSSRRSVLKGLALAVGTGMASYSGYRHAQISGWMADYRTETGAQRSLVLPDGSQLVLNTASALDVAFDAHQRCLIIREGEVLITTAADSAGRPFLVQTAQGTVQALGTRFSVRQQDNQAQVAVFEHQVRITPLAGQPKVLEAGTQCNFDSRAAGLVQLVTPGQDAWVKGILVANDQRLDSFIAELSRYRAGWLRCSPEVARLRISGAFNLKDTDQALQALTTSLPVRIEQQSRYWVTVLPR